MILSIHLLIPEDENMTISFKPEKEGELSKEREMLESTLFHVNLQLKEVRQCSIIGINSVWIITEWLLFCIVLRYFHQAWKEENMALKLFEIYHAISE